jgi:Ca2+/Na+ antiporter
MTELLLTIGGFLFILGGSTLFSHSAEALTQQLFKNPSLGRRILGNISLSIPELVLPLFSFLGGSGSGRKDAGIGGILGAPLFLIAILWPITLFITRKSPAPAAEKKQLGKEAPVIAAGLAAALLAGQSSSITLHWSVAILLIFLYPAILFTIKGDATENIVSEQTGNQPFLKTGFLFLIGVGFLIIGPILLLRGILFFGGPNGGTTIFILSLILSSLSTESPEALSLFMLLKRRDIPAAYAVLWGSIHFQLTVSLASGLLFSTWNIEKRHIVVGIILIIALLLSTLWARSEPVRKNR